MSSGPAVALQQARKPYTITKQRERWTEEEHAKFLEALKLHGRAWRRIEEYIGTKTAVQIRSHAQKFFSKIEREQASGIVTAGQDIEVPPPRPKRKPSHPYPKKACSVLETEQELLPLQLSTCPSSVECSRASPGQAAVTTSLKLFGKTVHVAVDVPEDDCCACLEQAQLSPKSGAEEESVMESGVTNIRSSGSTTTTPCPDDKNSNTVRRFNLQTCEVSSRDQEVPGAAAAAAVAAAAVCFDSRAQQLEAAIQAGIQMQDSVPLNNLIAWHYANLLAGFQSGSLDRQVGGGNPWQLLDAPAPAAEFPPKSKFLRWASLDSTTDKDLSTLKRRSDGVDMTTRKNAHVKRRRQRSSSCSSSSVTSSSVCEDECNDVSCSNFSTALILERQENDPRTGGFVRYKRPH